MKTGKSPDVEEVRAHFNYDSETGILTRIKSATRPDCIGRPAGSINSFGYLVVSFKSRPYKAHRIAWLIYYGEWPEEDIDHIDRNKLNNSIANLRKATRSQNAFNVGLRKCNTSGFRGVSFNAEWGKWFSQIIIRGEKKFLGYFKTPELASEAYERAASEAFGEFYTGVNK